MNLRQACEIVSKNFYVGGTDMPQKEFNQMVSAVLLGSGMDVEDANILAWSFQSKVYFENCERDRKYLRD